MAKITKLEWKKRQKAHANILEKCYRSYNSKSMTHCFTAKRNKILYESEKKAELAIKFSNGDIVRSYPCRTCMGWHTTSKTEEEYNQKRLEFSKTRNSK